MGIIVFSFLSGFSSRQAKREGGGGGSAWFYKLLQVRHWFGIVRDGRVEIVGEGEEAGGAGKGRGTRGGQEEEEEGDEEEEIS